MAAEQQPVRWQGLRLFGVQVVYVKPLKRFLQLLYATGLAGSLYLMFTQVHLRLSYWGSL